MGRCLPASITCLSPTYGLGLNASRGRIQVFRYIELAENTKHKGLSGTETTEIRPVPFQKDVESAMSLVS